MDSLKGFFYVMLMFFDALPLTAKLVLLVLVTMCAFFITITLTATFFR